MPASTGSPELYAESSRTRALASVTEVGATLFVTWKQVPPSDPVMVSGASWVALACERMVTLPVPGGTLKVSWVPTDRLQNVCADWASAEALDRKSTRLNSSHL